MNETIIDYYKYLPEYLQFVPIPEQCDHTSSVYRMISDYGKGWVRIMNVHDQFLIVTADFIPKENFEKVSEIKQEYFEISQFETNSSSYKVGGRKIKQVESGICCYVNRNKAAYVFCEAGKHTKFTKIIFTKEYFDLFLQNRYQDGYDHSKSALDFLIENPNSPELNFVFQQIRDCPAEGRARHLYMESKVIEILSLITYNKERSENKKRVSVKVDQRDKKNLHKTIQTMKKKLSAYPSIVELSQIANMSTSRFQMAFRYVYGTTPYEYLKMLRMNAALLLIKNSDYTIGLVAKKVGYNHAGHFSKLFKTTYGLSPQEYRDLHKIK